MNSNDTYTVGNVTYVVSRTFNPDSKEDLRKKLNRIVRSNTEQLLKTENQSVDDADRSCDNGNRA